MTQQQLTAIWLHLSCAEATANEATRIRIAEAKKIVSSELDRPLIKTGRTPGNTTERSE